ncbi:hypothetical protein POTOM_036862 [Populus tomentosa]|uniref:ABC1 atypical kinase-like domain-containing protein n=1 Tax=Populus tomentosa TaxID=118781 RepID=A0A8X7YZM4_POPTO|nr:hypothetical protein POTOM_036862 [Populus tomentosa]
MAIVTVAAASAMPTCALFRESKTATTKKILKRQGVRAVGNFSHFGDTVRKDFEFIKKRINKGMDWANEAFRIPQVSKTLDDILWLRNLEDHNSPPIEPQSWPQPSYPGQFAFSFLLFISCYSFIYLVAFCYFYCLSKIWSKPLPEAYDPQEVADYFNCRPHLVAFRLLELVSRTKCSCLLLHLFSLQDAHSSFSFMYAPKIFPDLSRKRVLTLEWVVGESPTDLLSLSTSSTYSERQKLEAKRRLLDLVSKGVEASLVQLLETGLLHGDPHPGNLRYLSSGQIGFLDFGLLCQMEKKHRFAMLAAIVHIVNGDWASLVHALIDMDVVRPGTSIRRITMELENSLGEVEFKDGIPDVKFSRVLGKILSIAIKNHFRMPPYFTLVLRSLASLEGLAVAADPNFKTFEAAYPYVVRKLLTENSAETRKILHLVVLNKQKEFRWERLALFLRVGSTRKAFNRVIASKNESSLNYLPNRSSGVFDTAHLVLRLLPSRDGIVLRKLLMTANGASLIRAMVSKEAIFVRQQLCRVIADVLYHWMTQTFGRGIMATWYGSQVRLTSEADNRELSPSSRLTVPVYDYQSIFRDRRLKVIFSRILDSARKDPALMLKFYWTTFAMVVTASVRACHRVLVSLSEAMLAPSRILPRVAISA